MISLMDGLTLVAVVLNIMYDLFLSSASVCQKDKLYTKQGTTYTIIKQELFEDLLDRSFQKLR